LVWFDAQGGPSFQGAPRLDSLDVDKTITFSQVSGIRIRSFSSGGFWYKSDRSVVLLRLTSIIVLLALPLKLTRFVALIPLGMMSKIYRRVLVQRFSVGLDIPGMVLRLISHRFLFNALANENNSDGDAVISRRRLEDEFRVTAKACKLDRLDDDEITQLSEFSYREAIKNSADKVSIDMDAYSLAFEASQPLDTLMVSTLFDRDRRVGVGEWLFTPPSLWALVHAPRATEVSEVALPDVLLDARHAVTISGYAEKADHVGDRRPDFDVELGELRAVVAALSAKCEFVHEVEGRVVDLEAWKERSEKRGARFEEQLEELHGWTQQAERHHVHHEFERAPAPESLVECPTKRLPDLDNYFQPSSARAIHDVEEKDARLERTTQEVDSLRRNMEQFDKRLASCFMHIEGLLEDLSVRVRENSEENVARFQKLQREMSASGRDVEDRVNDLGWSRQGSASVGPAAMDLNLNKSIDCFKQLRQRLGASGPHVEGMAIDLACSTSANGSVGTAAQDPQNVFFGYRLD